MEAIVISPERQQKIDQKKKQVEMLAKWAFIGIGCAVTAPIALASLVGLTAWVIVAALIAVIYTLGPVFGAYMGNKKADMLEQLEIQRMKDITRRAEENPIETMEVLHKEKSQELAVAEQNTTQFETQVANFLNVVEDMERDQPEDAPPFRAIHARMSEGVALMNKQLSEARHELKEFAAKIKRAKVIFKASEAANAILNLSAEVSNAKIYQKIKEDVAFDTVRSSLNHTFASLNQTIQRGKDFASMSEPKLVGASSTVQQPKALVAVPDEIEMPKRSLGAAVLRQ